MFIVTYTPEGGTSPDDDLAISDIRSIDIAPPNDKTQPESIRLNAGIGGGGGQLGGGILIPIDQVVSIVVEVAGPGGT